MLDYLSREEKLAGHGWEGLQCNQNHTYDMKTFKYTFKIIFIQNFSKKGIYLKRRQIQSYFMYFTFEVLDIFVDSVDVVGDCLVNDLQGGVHPHHRGQQGRRDQGQQGEAQHSQS